MIVDAKEVGGEGLGEGSVFAPRIFSTVEKLLDVEDVRSIILWVLEMVML